MGMSYWLVKPFIVADKGTEWWHTYLRENFDGLCAWPDDLILNVAIVILCKCLSHVLGLCKHFQKMSSIW